MEHSESRRAFLKQSISGAAAFSIGLSVIGSLFPSAQVKASGINHFLKNSGNDAKAFCEAIMPRAQLSLVASKIALDKSLQKNTKEFAGFEFMEAKTVIKVLKELGIKEQPLAKESKALIASLKASSGTKFDKLYMQAELTNHEFLRNLADNYLSEAKVRNMTEESEARHLASVALFAFTEHVIMSKRIYEELSA